MAGQRHNAYRGPKIRWLVTAAATCAVAACALAPAATAAGTAFEPRFRSNAKLLTSTPVSITAWGELKLTSPALGEVACDVVMAASVRNEAGRGVGAVEGLTAPRCRAPTIESVYEATYCTPEKGCPKPPAVFETAELPLQAEPREAEVCAEEAKTELSQCPNSLERSVQSLPMMRGALRRRAASTPWKLQLITSFFEEAAGPGLQLGGAPGGAACYPKETVEGKQVAAKWQSVPAGCIRLDLVVPGDGFEEVIYGSAEGPFVNGAGNGLDASYLNFTLFASKLTSEGAAAPEFTTAGTIRLDGSEARELITGCEHC
jgi:hypothetical protein